MSAIATDPTLVTTAPTVALDPTAATEAALDIESIKQILDSFDPASLLPDLGSVLGIVATVCRFSVLIGPIILLILGIAYLFFSPKEANYHFGYRCYYGMGSVQAWRFTQRLAGVILGGLGLVLTLVMFFLGSGFAAMDPETMVWKALTCLIWEAVLALLANGAICGLAALNFDRKGEYRRKK